MCDIWGCLTAAFTLSWTKPTLNWYSNFVSSGCEIPTQDHTLEYTHGHPQHGHNRRWASGGDMQTPGWTRVSVQWHASHWTHLTAEWSTGRELLFTSWSAKSLCVCQHHGQRVLLWPSLYGNDEAPSPCNREENRSSLMPPRRFSVWRKHASRDACRKARSQCLSLGTPHIFTHPGKSLPGPESLPPGCTTQGLLSLAYRAIGSSLARLSLSSRRCW